MTNGIPINLAVEDEISELVLRRILKEINQNFDIGRCYGHQGFGYLKRIARGLNKAARGTPWVLLTDLDTAECPPDLITDWISEQIQPNFLFRVAVPQVESWLLADHQGLATYLGVNPKHMPEDPDSLQNAKQRLINVARRSRRTTIQVDIVPPETSRRPQGPGYNGRLGEFVRNHWNIDAAATRSNSLQRCVNRIQSFQPIWPT